MNLKDVRARVEEIRAEAADDESAHSDEDNLYIDVLEAIASTSDEHDPPHVLARAALETRGIEFARWCA